jgi:hypothetical protein
MADDPMGMEPAGGSGPNPAVLQLAMNDDDAFELGYEAADPLLLERLWGDSVTWPAEHQP